jgi:bacterioferritin-associated ferredoxin
VFVCLCNALTDRDICQAAEACSKVADVYRCCGCEPECNKCVPYVRDAVRASADRRTLGASEAACDAPGADGDSVAV